LEIIKLGKKRKEKKKQDPNLGPLVAQWAVVLAKTGIVEKLWHKELKKKKIYHKKIKKMYNLVLKIKIRKTDWKTAGKLGERGIW